MRKLSAIMLALLLVSGVAMAQVTVSGTVDWSSLYYSDDGTSDATARGRAETKFTAPVDDYNTAVVKIRYIDNTLDNLQEAYFDTDWAGAFGLDQAAPVGLDSRMGYHEYDNPEYGKVTGQEIENVDAMGKREWNYQIVLSALDLVNLQVNVSPGSAPLSSGGRDLAVGAYGGGDFDFGTLNAELFFYAQDGAEAGDGNILFGVGYSNAIVPDLVALSVGTTFDYYLADVADGAPEWALGAGVSATFIDMITLGLGLAGNSEVPAGALGIDLGAAYMDLIGFDLGVVLALDEDYTGITDQQTLDYLEASVVLMVGAGNFRVGYAYDGQDDATAGNIDTDYKIGGAFNPIDTDAGTNRYPAKGAIFIRTSIDY